MSPNKTELRGRRVVDGYASAEALVTKQPISFLGGIDPSTGTVIERRHELYGACIKDKILIFPSGKGSTVGSYVIYSLKRQGVAPAGMINEETETIIATGCVLAEIPLVDRLAGNIFEIAASGDRITVDGNQGLVTVTKAI